MNAIVAAGPSQAMPADVDQERNIRARRVSIPPSLADAGLVGVLVALLLVSPALSELTTYRIGLVVITGVSVLGMHVLVNWAGQLSLAQGAFVGIPAFIAARLAAEQSLPVTVTLPIAVAVGAAIGVFVSLPALRVRGIQVAIATLLFGVATDAFLFQNPWFTGSSVVQVPPVHIGNRVLTTSRDLFPAPVGVFGLCLWATRRVERSTLRRALLLVRTSDELAEAAGVSAPRYKMLAYVYAGAFAGIAATMLAYWVGQVGPSSFSVNFSLLVLTIAIVGGNGSLLGPLLATVLFTAHDVPDWLPPLALLVVVVWLPGGLNDIGRRLLALPDRLGRSRS
jgi:branched-chain amino acid transport system permease protein